MNRTARELAATAGFLGRLGPFLRETVEPSAARERLAQSMARRASAFCTMLRRGVFAHAHSPYRSLLDAARLDADAVERMVRQLGVDGTLERLHDAGVFVRLEEFKGLAPIVRPGVELAVRAEDFDNPLTAHDYETRTGGSGGRPRRILVDLDLLAHEADYHAGFYATRGADHWCAAMWLPAPPGAVGIKSVLIRARLGATVDRWFTQSQPGHGGMKHRAFAGATRVVARALGRAVPVPEFTPATEAGRVASWLAERRRAGPPAILLTTPSAAVRTCAAAARQGHDISGSLLVLVGEPFTAAKAEVIARARCRAAAHYAMVESGLIGLACGDATMPDDVHLVGDKVATIQRHGSVGGGGSTTAMLLHTTLLAAAPKLMLNVESGDTGVLEERDCACGALPPSFRRHLHSIRSYEKLTSEGMHFLGTDLIPLLEEVLVRQYGGQPTDWQLVEEEVDGLSRVSLVASPAIGAFDEDRARETVLAFLRGRGAGQGLMAEVWSNGGTLRVVRREPHVTPGGKVLALQRR